MRGKNILIGALMLCANFVEQAHGQCTNGAGATVFGFRRIIDGQPVSGVTVAVSSVTNLGGPCAASGNPVVDFTFRNIVGGDAPRVSDVWFDDRCVPGMPLMTLCQIIGDNSGGHVVNFSQGGAPQDPPNAQQLCPPFETTMQFSADADPGQENSMDPGEFLTMRFVLHAGSTVNDVIACLEQADPGVTPCIPGLRVAFKLDTPGGGASSVNNPEAFVGGDCDCDGVPDECEISCSGDGGLCAIYPGCGSATDCNGNHIPDSCETCTNPPTAPASASALPSSFCTGNVPATISLAASGGSGDVLRWYTSSCGGTLVGTGSPLSLSPPGASTTYYARWESNSCLCSPSACAAVTVTVATSPATPVSPTASPPTVCEGQTTTLSATVGAGVTVDWFTGSCGGTPVPGGASPTVSPATTMTYFARARNTTNACFSESCASVTVMVTAGPAVPVNPTATPSAICAGQSAMLSATVPPGITVEWFTEGCGGAPVAGGATPVVSPSATTTYYARARNPASNCPGTSCASVTLTVIATPPAPVLPTASPSTICQGQSSTLTATTVEGATVDWFTGNCGGTPVAGGASPTVSPMETTTYFARARNASTGCASGSCAAVTVTVNAAPAIPVSPTAMPPSICQGQSSTLSASVPAGVTVEWFTESCGGTPVPGGATPGVSPTATTTYYARANSTTGNCPSEQCASVTLTVNALPAAPNSPTATPSTLCEGQSATLSATTVEGASIEWFTESCGGTPVPGGALPVVSPAVTTTYYARSRVAATGCESSSCATVTVTVNAAPATPVSPAATPSTICQGQSSTLTATTIEGASVEWFTESCGGTPVPGGAAPVVSPTTTTAFFARAKNSTTGCTSLDCASVTVSVDTAPDTPVNPAATPSTICPGQNSTLTASVPDGVTVEWFTERCGDTPVPGGASPTVSPTITTTYYAQARANANGCASIICASVTVSVDPAPDTPSDPAAMPNPVCAGQNATLSSTVPTGVTVEWFTESCGGTPVPGGATPLVTPTATTTYYARARISESNCTSVNCASVTLIVEAAPAPPVNPIATPPTLCEGQSATLSATTVEGASVEWFTESCGGSPVPGGALPVVSPSVTTTYYARSRISDTGCVSTTCAEVTVIVDPAPDSPVDPTATPGSICEGQSSTLSAVVPDGVIVEWFAESCGGAPVPGGAEPTVTPLVTTTYYARAKNGTTGCTSINCATVTVQVDETPDTPVNPTATPNPICEGLSSTLSAEVPDGVTVEWFTESCGGTPVPGGATPAVSPSATTTYYALARNTTGQCASAICATLTVTVKEAPAAPLSAIADPPQLCLPGGPLCATLTAILGPAGPPERQGDGVIIEWFAGGCGSGEPVGTGLSIQVCPTAPTTYFARSRDTVTDCASILCADAAVAVVAGPSAPTNLASDPPEFCVGTATTITLTAEGGAGTSVRWFDDACGGNEIGATTPLTIPAPSQSTTYYARMEQPGCDASTCSSVTVGVHPLPDAPTVTASPVAICLGECTTLIATPGSGGDTVEWFADACDGGENPPLDGPTPQVCPTQTTTYYVRTRNSTTDCVSETCDSAQVIVNPVPAAPIQAMADPPVVCPGACTTLTAVVGPRRGTGVTIDWFAGGCGAGEPVGTGFSIQVCLTVETTYFARERETQTDCTSPSCASATVGVTPPPMPPTSFTTSPDGFCEGFEGNLTLTANGGSGETLHWFQGACGEGEGLGTGNPIVVPAPVAPTTYCARWTVADCPPSECTCLTIVPGDCDDGDLCTIDSCDPKTFECVHTPIENCCTQPADCDDGDPCMAVSCVDNQCVRTPIENCCTEPIDCDDGKLCTSDACVDNRCVYTQIPGCCLSDADCDDGDPCTADSCVDNRCVYTVVDSDGDGVPNCRDLCPNTPAGEPVDANGCSCSQLDDDHDGVDNCRDLCPDTPPNTPVDVVGCPLPPEPTCVPGENPTINILLSQAWLTIVCGSGCPPAIVAAVCGLVTMRRGLRLRRRR
jgi:hypothetical protein